MVEGGIASAMEISSARGNGNAEILLFAINGIPNLGYQVIVSLFMLQTEKDLQRHSNSKLQSIKSSLKPRMTPNLQLSISSVQLNKK
jgi:hypothetical protein